MPRRTHKKSRNGCFECKRRHMKCDEKKPICSNCISSQRYCEFVEAAPIAKTSYSASGETAPAPSAVPSPASQLNKSLEDDPVSMLHMELLYHTSSETLKSVYGPATLSTLPFQEILKYGLAAPYLMNELLALGALHLSVVRKEQCAFYRHHSSHLQNYALSSFNKLSPHITEENCVPIFLFAGMLGLHMLCETLVFRDDDFESFLDRFVQYNKLHHGVQTVVNEGRWQILQQSTLRPFLEIGEELPPLESSLSFVCNGLFDRIKALGLDEFTTRKYEQAVQALQSVQTVIERENSRDNSIFALIAWPVLVPFEYIELLSKKKEEALVILAYYGALVATHKDHWVCCDGGKYMVDSICQYLGLQWEDWLQWPRKALTETTLVQG
ncbi:Zn(II)2Cys6 transcription factor domain-containing protein [Aspergillus affinis]|uniref:Zn(II)2Cys6 transcription factor domain-containing protein n=1 Tax=Aspergillus affinis TaxID=1070780 RepID=UPI0022FE0401|nr:uncharacterized protein KD926_000813 [Aspergillus affinis]KAI9037165.1 hypothetical protein KD926_000813 [Aspergillus affinis]